MQKTNNMIELIKGDITQLKVDAIVNAANSSLMGGGGVDGAIHRAGGPEILEACKKIRQEQGELPPGEAVMTAAGKLPARYVIHTVGPVWQGGVRDEGQVLANAYRNSLRLADEHFLAMVAFPNISTGVYGFPKKRAAEIAVQTVSLYLEGEASTVQRVKFVCFDDENHEIYKLLLHQK